MNSVPYVDAAGYQGRTDQVRETDHHHGDKLVEENICRKHRKILFVILELDDTHDHERRSKRVQDDNQHVLHILVDLVQLVLIFVIAPKPVPNDGRHISINNLDKKARYKDNGIIPRNNVGHKIRYGASQDAPESKRNAKQERKRGNDSYLRSIRNLEQVPTRESKNKENQTTDNGNKEVLINILHNVPSSPSILQLKNFDNLSNTFHLVIIKVRMTFHLAFVRFCLFNSRLKIFRVIRLDIRQVISTEND